MFTLRSLASVARIACYARPRILEKSWQQGHVYLLGASAFGSCKQLGNCKMSFSEEELKKRLTPIQYQVTQEKGTERPFTGELNDEMRPGMYKCVVCGAELFKSETKFDAGCGWPSFYDQVDEAAVTMTEDNSFGMVRTETTCSKCGAHLGHLFDDGPKPTGQRYCINSASLKFDPKSSSKKEEQPKSEL